ncbi:MAG: sigma 54-interacting transcriptional regulator [Planctomycetes bacterium]|nr:sigma 54-interacting transcriptional regulator [Planctomycetota bacterium]
MAKLTVISGDQKGFTFQLPAEPITLGRDFSNEIQLQGQKISRTHAKLERDAQGWLITDLGSRNGTFVNGQTVKACHLHSRDEIRLGDVCLVFLTEEEEIELPDDAGAEVEENPQEILAETVVNEASAILAPSAVKANPTEIERLNTRLRALLDLTRRVGSARSLPELMEGVGKAVQACLEPDRIVPIVMDEDGALLPWALSRSDFDHDLAAIPISRSIVEHASKNRVAVLSRQTSQDRRFRTSESIVRLEIASAMCVPIVREDRLLGLLYVDRVGVGSSFDREDLEMLGAIGVCTAAPLDNISFYHRISHEKQVLEREIRVQYNLIGQSDAMKTVFNFIEKAASSDACVLVTGESGTGKELVARAIHYNSRRNGRAFEIVNCAALNHTLLDSELFGHAKGAFTDAREDKPGRFELADKGSIFLDEIGELSEASQSKLLRVLEDGELRRLGETRDRHVNLRVIAATNRDLRQAIEERRFREDLFYRLNVLRLHLPPLRERMGDIEILAEHYLKEFGNRCARPALRLSEEARQALLSYRWPGNVRELKNVIERMVVMSSGTEITLQDVPAEVRGGPGPASPAASPPGPLASLDEVEKEHILRVLQQTRGNKKEAASILGIDRSTLYARLKAHGIEA